MQAGVRITGGYWRGRRLPVVKGVRPSSGRVREALTSHWQARIIEARFLDVCAGSGAMSFEVLGRGAALAVAIDSSDVATQRIRLSAREWGADALQVQRRKVPDELAAVKGPFDLIFADPPYDFVSLENLLLRLVPLLAEQGECAVETRANTCLPECVAGLSMVWRRDYGDSKLSIYQHCAVGHDPGVV